MSVPEHPPEAVIKAALMHPVPCKTCGAVFHTPLDTELDAPGHDTGDRDYELDFTSRLIVQALIEHGHLPDPDAQPEAEAEAMEQTAVWLAAQTRHPRYAGTVDGWKALLDPASENNIHHAHAAALKAHPQPSREYETNLAAARDALLAYVAARRAAGDRG
jgi:hypothetical protein